MSAILNAALQPDRSIELTHSSSRRASNGNSGEKQDGSSGSIAALVPSPLSSKRGNHPRTNWSAIGLIGLVHALAVFALLQIDSVRDELKKATPLMVSLISEPRQEKPPEVPPAPTKLMMVNKLPAPAVLPPVVEVSTPQSQAQPAISVAEVRPIPAAPEAKPSPAKPPEIIPPNFVVAYLDNPAPSYPPIAKRMREQGTVILRVLVTPEGRADKVEVQTTSGSPRLDTAAQSTVQKWRFVPARQGTQAVTSWVLVPIDFQLTS